MGFTLLLLQIFPKILYSANCRLVRKKKENKKRKIKKKYKKGKYIMKYANYHVKLYASKERCDRRHLTNSTYALSFITTIQYYFDALVGIYF